MARVQWTAFWSCTSSWRNPEISSPSMNRAQSDFPAPLSKAACRDHWCGPVAVPQVAAGTLRRMPFFSAAAQARHGCDHGTLSSQILATFQETERHQALPGAPGWAVDFPIPGTSHLSLTCASQPKPSCPKTWIEPGSVSHLLVKTVWTKNATWSEPFVY